MSNRSKTNFAAKLLDVLHEGAARELCAIVGDDPVRDPEAANNRPDELPLLHRLERKVYGQWLAVVSS